MTGESEGAKTAVPTSSKILLDGKEVAFTAYNIDGNNYFKLRDIGQAFDFGVDWDGARNTIVIDTGKGYAAEGAAAASPAPTSKSTPAPSQSGSIDSKLAGRWKLETGNHVLLKYFSFTDSNPDS